MKVLSLIAKEKFVSVPSWAKFITSSVIPPVLFYFHKLSFMCKLNLLNYLLFLHQSCLHKKFNIYNFSMSKL